MNRKSRSLKVLQDSDSEKGDEATGMAPALVLSESSGEEMKTSESERRRKKQGKRISRISMDSDESESEKDDVKQGKRKREKSRRRKDKEDHRGALVKQLRERSNTEVRSI